MAWSDYVIEGSNHKVFVIDYDKIETREQAIQVLKAINHITINHSIREEDHNFEMLKPYLKEKTNVTRK